MVEGEKDTDGLIQRGLLATTNPRGARKWNADYSRCLTERDVVILPDNDSAGKAHAAECRCRESHFDATHPPP